MSPPVVADVVHLLAYALVSSLVSAFAVADVVHLLAHAFDTTLVSASVSVSVQMWDIALVFGWVKLKVLQLD
eukprot:CAMPEP_0171317086 /NCGR_PEP_ID=MMETSP0816-20121228/78008_1 /TAXON_ID=420281 /ORGANISM="Proboscia inermis, Strain CCAP1064/1" /LENGTH=71 /DNA_ID=CAMNT_0011809933 /DNA_START=189 /DNA_END=404 /DNA_ORIENTATION=+